MYAYWTRTRIITFLMTCSTCPCNFVSIVTEKIHVNTTDNR